MTTTPPPGAPGDRLAYALNYALGTLQQAGSGYPRGMAAAILMATGRGLDQPPAAVTLVRNFDGDVIAVTLQAYRPDAAAADLADCMTPGHPTTDATIGDPARADMIGAWTDLHAAGQWDPRDIMVQAGPHGGSVMRVCDPDAPNPDHERVQFLVGVVDGLRILGLASQ